MSETLETGLTMEQASPDLTTTESAEVTDTAPAEEAVTEKKQTTKKVSDRINKIREEEATKYNGRIKELEEQLKGYETQLRTYKAKDEGITVEEFDAREQSEAQKIKEALYKDPEFIALRQKEFERQKQDVLTQLQNGFPEDNIEDIDDLPQEFFKMLQAGVDPEKAYKVAVFDERKPAPATSSSAKSDGEAGEKAITPEMIESMSTKDVAKNLDKIMEAYKKW